MKVFTPFDPWKGNLCSCPKKYSLSAYVGCGHKCLYCYASSYIKDFFIPRQKNNFLKNLKNEVKRLPKNSLITISNSSDPYLPLEKSLKLTFNTLKILKDYELKIMIITKSSLILRDIYLLKEFKSLIISFTLTTLDKNLAKRLEPVAPSPQQRLKAIEILSDHFKVVCRIDPLIYPLNIRKIKNLIKELKNRGIKQIISSTYKVKPDNFKRMSLAFPEYKKTWQKLYFLKGEKIGGYFYLPFSLRKELVLKLRDESLKEGLEFSSCREGLIHLNTKNCDGSSFV